VVTIQFDKNVVVTGKPQILLATGTTNRLVDYVGMTNFDTLRFNYVVQGGDTSNDLDYVGTTSLTLNGGPIKLGSNNAVLTLPAPGASGSLGFNKNIVIDTTPPIVAISSPSDDATLNTATVVVSGISSDTIGSGVQKVEVSIDSGSYTLAYGTTAWSFTTSELSIGSHTITAKATDIAGNTATTSTITITVAPLTLVLSSTSYSLFNRDYSGWILHRSNSRAKRNI
jgi:hypothetical protein